MPTTYAIPNGRTVMDATTYTGNGGTQSVVNAAGFKPDLVWIKNRTNAYNHREWDSVRGVGAGNSLMPNLTDAQGNSAQEARGLLTALNSNGFTVGPGSTDAIGVNESGSAFVGWQWQAGQGTTSSNTNGSITSTVSVNQTAGFSIVTYTGNNTLSTVGHGLGASPQFIIVKTRSGVDNWECYHASLGVQYYTMLNSTSASLNNLANYWGSSPPSSTTFSINAYGGVNTNGATYVAYCWAAIPGFSAFGSYTGNGSNDGPFVYTGFRPKFVMIKCSSTGGAGYDWFMWDSSRNTYNVVDHAVWANLSDAENTTAMVDLVSNGFKIRLSSSAMNANGATYIYMAFAENPFKYANAR